MWLDVSIRKDKHIRGLCVNPNSGLHPLYSVPIDVQREDADTILEKAQLKAPMNVKKIRIPEFDFYGLADPKDQITEESGPVDEKAFLETVKTGGRQVKGRISPEDFNPCIKKILSMRTPDNKPNHMQMFLLTAYLHRKGYPSEDILCYIRQIFGEEYDETTASSQVKAITGKNYAYPKCKKIRDEYEACIGPECRWYGKNFGRE